MTAATIGPLRLGVLASHNGTTLQAILDAIAAGQLAARVCVVISNNGSSGALRRAEGASVPTRHLSSATHPDEAGLDHAIVGALTEAGCDVVFLAGYMKRLGPSTLKHFEGRILNTHPALLPRFGGHGMYGNNVHRAVLAAGERESGASIHLVEAEYDTGRVLRQARVPVEPSDTEQTLADRVQAAERQLVLNVLNDIALGRLAL